MPARSPLHRAGGADRAPSRAADVIEIGEDRRLRLTDVLGRGATSVVHRAVLEHAGPRVLAGRREAGVRRLVAVKIFGSVASEEVDTHVEAAARTATRAASVRHPNVVEMYDFGQWRAQPYFVTELVEGVNLQALLERYSEKSLRLPLDLALFIGCEVAEALSGARTARDHRGMQVGMLHLALGARKILLGWRGEVKVTDFETSMAADASSSIRSMQAVAHRTATMAPEVAQGLIRGDSRSDVFSLGIVLREMFVGSRFGRVVKNAEAVRLAREGFVQPMSFQPHLPPALVQILERALELDPGDRYPNASAMAFELRRLALAMGVGDGRLFLRRTLDRELGNDASEVTAELLSGSLPPAAIEVPRGRGRAARNAPEPVRIDDLTDLDGLPAFARCGADYDVAGGSIVVSDADILDADILEDD